MSLANLQAIVVVQASTPVGLGRFATSVPFNHTPAGASPNLPLPIGAGPGQVGDVYNADPHNVVAGTPAVITLSSLLDPAGQACNFQHVSHVLLENLSTTSAITLAPGGTNGVAWLPAGGITLPPSNSASQASFLMLAVPVGLAVAAGSADTMQVAASTGTAQFNLTLLGRSA